MQKRLGLSPRRSRVANTWYLFGKDAMKLGIDAVSVDCQRNEFVRCYLDRARSYLDQGAADQLQHFVRMALTDGSNQRLLTREILVERSNADACHSSDLVGASPGQAPFFINTASS